MPRICVFKPSDSLNKILKCTRHPHISREDADARVAKGELVAFDATGKRFEERGGLGLARVHLRLPHTGLSPRIIEAAAVGDPHAHKLVEDFDAEALLIKHVTVDDSDVWFNVEREGTVPVFAVLKRQRLEVIPRCVRFLARRPRSGKLNLSEIGKLDGIVRGLRQESRDAKQILREIWPKVFVQFTAKKTTGLYPGARFMSHLNATPPDELPAAITYFTLQAYMRGEWPPQQPSR